MHKFHAKQFCDLTFSSKIIRVVFSNIRINKGIFKWWHSVALHKFIVICLINLSTGKYWSYFWFLLINKTMVYIIVYKL